MRRGISFLIGLLFLGAAAPVQARQAISKSMAECGALMDVAGLYVETPERKALIGHAAVVWTEASKQQAKIEGWIAGDLTQAYAEKFDAWQARGAPFVLSQEFRDWTSYCRALALRYDVVFDQVEN